MTEAPTQTTAGQRGPADHAIRAQIVQAAGDHFLRYGYGKTTVSDLAKAIGFSKAYIYKFFESKQAIGEAICTDCTSSIVDLAQESVASGRSATEKLRNLFRSITDRTLEYLFEERKLFDIVVFAVLEDWSSTHVYLDQIKIILEQILLEGRASGEFERKTPMDETTRAILQAMQPFIHPMMLERNLDRTTERLTEVVNLVLRSLAP
jgi:AcrR family transcriptional regulator